MSWKWCEFTAKLLVRQQSTNKSRDIFSSQSGRAYRFRERVLWSGAKLHMSLSRHLQNGVPMSPSSEICHILVTCRHVVAT
eukprot:scaffold162190_cov40-Cyclotella_meneghiniana.AAC.1